jgi:hypothetical protein
LANHLKSLVFNMKNFMETKIGARFAAAVGAVLTVAGLSGCATNDCTTTVRGTQTRSVSGNDTSAWRGAEVMTTTCRYKGDTDPRAFKAPGHLEHMNNDRNAQKPGLVPWQ